MATATSRVRIGRVVKPHGIQGELVVAAAGDTLAALPPDSTIWLGRDETPRALAEMRPHAGRWLVRVEGVGDRDSAERLRGAAITIDEADLPSTGPGEAYVDRLVGCELYDANGTHVGRIVGVREGGPHDLLEVATGDDTALVPMVAGWLEELDLSGRRLTMTLPEGLV